MFAALARARSQSQKSIMPIQKELFDLKKVKKTFYDMVNNPLESTP
jgi:hypothetical protein